MERSQITRQIVVCGVLLLVLAGCKNPFAPSLRGGAASPFTDASTVGGLLQNFVTAYELRDSLRYAELLDDEFQFQYYDPTLQRTDGWFRETDLRTTARMFRSFQNITLIWVGLSAAEEAVSTPNTLVEVRVQYQLVLDELSPVIGSARFTLFKPDGGRYRIVLWQDEL